MRTTVTLTCKQGRPGCIGSLEREIDLAEGVQPPTTFTCANCAGKVDKRGVFRKPRPRRALSLDHWALHSDERYQARPASGMTEAHIEKRKSEPLSKEQRQKLFWDRVRANGVELLSVTTDPTDHRILELFLLGYSYAEAANILEDENVKCSRPNVPLQLKRIVREARSKLAVRPPEHPERLRPTPTVEDTEEGEMTLAEFTDSEEDDSLKMQLIGQTTRFDPYGVGGSADLQRARVVERIAATALEDLDSECLDILQGIDRYDEELALSKSEHWA